MQDRIKHVEDWKEEDRSKMFSHVMVALDAARGEAQELGDDNYVRHVENVLFPFIEKEMFNAEVEEAAQEELAAAIGVRKLPELSDEEHAEGRRLVRRADAFGLMRMALYGDTIVNDEEKQNALNELRHLEEAAENALRHFQRKHGIPVSGE